MTEESVPVAAGAAPPWGGRGLLVVLRLELFEEDVFEFDLHGRAHVELEAQEALHGAALGVFVDDHAHDAAVDDVGDDDASGDDVDLVPVSDFDHGFEFIGRAGASD